MKQERFMRQIIQLELINVKIFFPTDPIYLLLLTFASS